MIYKVFGKNIKLYRKNLLQHGIVGLFEGTTGRITIDSTLRGDELDHTLLHELVHALWHRLGMMQTQIPHEVQELICENVATMITENFSIKKK
jgi:Zn-dependent peptidase ImmA (M78 family)